MTDLSPAARAAFDAALTTRGIRAEVTAWVDAQPKRARMALDRDRATLERLGVW